MTTTGGCLCRAVRFTIEAAPMAARMCWCRLCQYLGGGGATVNVCFPAEAVKTEGQVRWHASVADSGNTMRAVSARPAARPCSASPRRGRT